MLCDASLYEAALSDLEKEFGDPSRVVQATMKKLLTARPVRDGELSALTELSRDLHTAVSVLQCLKYESDLAASTNVTAVTGKLPANLAWKWGEHVIERDITRPTLVDLDGWLQRHVAAGRVAVTLTDHKQPPPKVEGNPERSRRVFTTAVSTACGTLINSETKAAIKSRTATGHDACVVCQQTHDIQHCEQFTALTVNERAAFAGREWLCFNCLARGHVSRRCPSDARCRTGHCGGRHHTLLHNSGRVFPRDDAGRVPASTDAKHVGTAAAEPRSQVLLQVIPVTVHGPAGSHTINALLDSGSQVTLVTDDLCDRLGISGPTDQLVLRTVNGSERLQSRRVNFSVQAAGNGREGHAIRNAQTTPTLNVTIQPVDWPTEKSNWPHLADLPLPRVTSGTVDLLLGADSCHLIVPREVIEGPAGTPSAVRTLLGWTVTGRAPRVTVDVAAGLEGQVRTTPATRSCRKRRAGARCAAAAARPSRPPPAARRPQRRPRMADSGDDVTADSGQRRGGNPVTSTVPELQRHGQPLPRPNKRLRRHPASWWTPSRKTTHERSSASVIHGRPPACGHQTAPGRDSPRSWQPAGGTWERLATGVQETGPGPPCPRTTPSSWAGRCRSTSDDGHQ